VPIRMAQGVIDPAQISEVIAMAWDDQTSFDVIKLQTGLSEGEVIKLMRQQLKPSSFRLWRKRVTGRAAKHDASMPTWRDLDSAES
jgi:uncharacterized protein (TIGR03643 family)